jgi:hypothetical protein
MELPPRLPLLNLPIVPFPGVAMELAVTPQLQRLFEQAGPKRLVFAICADTPMAAAQHDSKVGGLAELLPLDEKRFRVNVVARGKLRDVESLTPVPVVSWDSMPEEESGEIAFLVGPLLQHSGSALPEELHAFLRLPRIEPDNAINLIVSRWPLTRAQHQSLLELPNAEARAKALMAGPEGGPPVGQTPLRLRLLWKGKTLLLTPRGRLSVFVISMLLGLVLIKLWKNL